MTKRVLSFIVVLSILFVLPASAPAPVAEPAVPVVETTESVENNVLKARFENMLNHNYLYDDDFDSDQIMIEDSILALLDKSVDGQIDQGLVLGFIAGMYGRQVDPAAAVYDFLPADEGMFAILARGYDAYEHTITAVEEIDGGYLVTSDVTVLPCDGFAYTTTASTVFVPNAGSAFGYNLVSSVLADPVIAPTL